MAARFRSWLPNILLLLGSVLVTLGILEVALRITGLSDSRPTPPPIYRENTGPEISYELKPSIAEKAFRNTVTTNSLGFRSPEIVQGKPLIAVLGDSITFGYGVADSETFPARLQIKLDDRYQVLNAGVPGYNLLQETATYEKKIAALKPSALVLTFFWNDLDENKTIAMLAPDGNIVPRGQPWKGVTCNPIEEGLMGWIPGRCWLDLHSALYRALKKTVSRRTEQANLAQQREESRATPFTETATERSLTVYAETLARLTKDLPAGMPRLFVIWPEKFLHLTYRPRLRAIAEANGFRVLDLYEVFGNSAKTLSWDTVHPAQETIEQAADVIAAAMKEWELLP